VGGRGLAVLWFVATALGVLDLPAVAAVCVLGVLVMLSVEPDARHPRCGVSATRSNLVLTAFVTVLFVPVALGADLLLGRVPLEVGPLVLGVLAALCVAVPRLAGTRGLPGSAVVGHRELIIGITSLVAGARAYQAGGDRRRDGRIRRDPARGRVGERVRRGRVIGQVGDSGNSGEPHLHLQVQNRPTFDVEDRSIRTSPILLTDATSPMSAGATPWNRRPVRSHECPVPESLHHGVRDRYDSMITPCWSRR
jgi:hypothetical protein